MLTPEKIEQTISRAEKALEQYGSPAILSSFGKDSLVLLHLFRHLSLPVIACVSPMNTPEQWEHARKVTQAWQLRVFELHPISMKLEQRGESTALISTFPTGEASVFHWIKRLSPGEKCVLSAPLGASVELPFDILLNGQKSGDPDFLGGTYKIESALTSLPVGPDYLRALHDWTDADIFEYAERFALPLDRKRYDLDKRIEHPDTVTSNDRLRACVACIDPKHAGQRVWCPKQQAEIPALGSN